MFLLYRSMETLQRYFPLQSKNQMPASLRSSNFVLDTKNFIWFVIFFFTHTQTSYQKVVFNIALNGISYRNKAAINLWRVVLLPLPPHQCMLEPSRDGHTHDANRQPLSWGGIFWFWVSMDSVEQILISKEKREMCYYIQMKWGKCKLSSCFFKEGLTGEEGI